MLTYINIFQSILHEFGIINNRFRISNMKEIDIFDRDFVTEQHLFIIIYSLM